MLLISVLRAAVKLTRTVFTDVDERCSACNRLAHLISSLMLMSSVLRAAVQLTRTIFSGVVELCSACSYLVHACSWC